MSLGISIAVPMALQRFYISVCSCAFDWNPLLKSLCSRLADFADLQVALLTSKTGVFGLRHNQTIQSGWGHSLSLENCLPNTIVLACLEYWQAMSHSDKCI